MQKLQLYIKWLREDLGGWVPLSLMFPDVGIGHLTLMSLSELNHRRNKRDEEDQFRRQLSLLLRFVQICLSGLSFLMAFLCRKLLTSFGLIISLHKSLKRKELQFALRADIFSLAGVLNSFLQQLSLKRMSPRSDEA